MPLTQDDLTQIRRSLSTRTLSDPNIDDLARIKLAKLSSVLNTVIINYILQETDYLVVSDTTTAALALSHTLPPAVNKQAIYFIRNTSGTYNTTINPNSVIPDTIEGSSSFVLSNAGEWVILVSDGVSNWMVFGHGIGPSGNILVGDVTGPLMATIVGAIQGNSVQVGTLTNKQFYVYDAALSKLIPFYPAPSGDVIIKADFSGFQVLGVQTTPFAITSSAPGVILAGIGGSIQTVPMQGDATIDGAGNVTVTQGALGGVKFSGTKTTVNGSVSGTLIWTMPEQGTAFKKVIIEFNSMDDAGSVISFPTSFSSPPAIITNTTGLSIATLTSSAITIPATAGVSGWIILEGF